MGAIPPLNDAQWADAFAKYQRIPQYAAENRGMTLDGFKGIFWWEWSHRFLGRFLGVLFAVPFVWFAATGAIARACISSSSGRTIHSTPASRTADGYELQLGTNHLGHFALTGLLLEALGRGTGPRVVTVSSIGHKAGHIHFDDLQLERGYAPRKAYRQSELANAIFGIELDRRLRAAGSPILSVLAHPGYSATNLQSTGPTGMSAFVMKLSNALIAQKADRGALPQLFAATAPTVRGGQFYGPSGFQEMRGTPIEVHAIAAAHDPATGRRLWSLSEQLTGVTFPLPTPKD